MGWSNAFGLLAKDTSLPLHYRFLKKRRHTANNIIAKSSRIANDPVLDPAGFDWTRDLAEHWQDIRDEAIAIIWRNIGRIFAMKRSRSIGTTMPFHPCAKSHQIIAG